MKNVLITGASRGIGRATAILLGTRGYRVGINYFTSKERAMEVKNIILAHGGEAEIYRADVSSYSQVEGMVRDFSEEFGKIYGLVANAGIYIRRNIREMSLEDWRKTIATNLDGTFYLARASLPYLTEKASMVFIASQLAFRGSPSSVAYSASKAGVLGLMRSLALQLAPNVRVNAVSPGTIDTDMISSYSAEQRKKREDAIPLRRIGTPKEVAETVAFLLSEKASYITGACLDVNGGFYIH